MENYFDMLGQNVPNEDKKEESQDMVNLTVRADAECAVFCDGDFLFTLEAGKLEKTQAPAGQHLLEFKSLEDDNIVVEKEVDFSDVKKNYLVIVRDFADIFASKNAKAAEEKAAKEAEEKRKVEEAEAKRKEEEEKIHTIRITDEYGNGGIYTGCLKDGKPNGKGRAEYDDGDVYEGEWQDGKRNGRCIIYFRDGTRYEGEFNEDDEFTGKCRWHFSDGSKLEGEYKQEGFHRYVSGVFTNDDGDTFEGDYDVEPDPDGNYEAIDC